MPGGACRNAEALSVLLDGSSAPFELPDRSGLVPSNLISSGVHGFGSGLGDPIDGTVSQPRRLIVRGVPRPLQGRAREQLCPFPQSIALAPISRPGTTGLLIAAPSILAVVPDAVDGNQHIALPLVNRRWLFPSEDVAR